jgi:uncharacterized protein YfiM (DUF2279 family)
VGKNKLFSLINSRKPYFCLIKLFEQILKKGKLIIFLLVFLNKADCFGQIDTVDSYKKNQNKQILKLASVNAVLYGGTMFGLYQAWYKNYPQSNFHVFNDWEEWQQMDKLGHVYSAYTMSKFGMELWMRNGMDREKSIWIGGITGAAYQTIIEFLDAYSAQWGWSWGDVGGNILGSALFTAQELTWKEQRIQLKMSFHKMEYSDPELNKRSDIIFGKTLAERALKDYNGQTYWLSANISSFFPNSKIPKWAMISIGTGANGMFGARSNLAKDNLGNIIFDRTNISRTRQWYLAPDVDLTKIKTKKKSIKALLFVLNSIKFPMPAIEFSEKKFKMRWVGF